MKYLIILVVGIFIGWKMNPRVENNPIAETKVVDSKSPSSAHNSETSNLAKIEIETIEENLEETEQIVVSPQIEGPSELQKNQQVNLGQAKNSQRQLSENSDVTSSAISKIKAELSEKLKETPQKMSKLSINLSQDQLDLLEKNLNELRETTSTLYKDGGWTVKFHDQKNILRLIGIRDSDFIRFETLANLKEDQFHGELASRFEKILQTLEE